MVYGYDTDLTQGLSANLIRIKDLGTNLLGSLVNKRQDDEVRHALDDRLIIIIAFLFNVSRAKSILNRNFAVP